MHINLYSNTIRNTHVEEIIYNLNVKKVDFLIVGFNTYLPKFNIGKCTLYNND